ncbi:MAG: hypothetical protein DLM73_07605 [Chthoniobacterales bacterium]|nr:MAG: hypothetical protein DLM73_07605 [Chthoniobacterales bacterium]
MNLDVEWTAIGFGNLPPLERFLKDNYAVAARFCLPILKRRTPTALAAHDFSLQRARRSIGAAGLPARAECQALRIFTSHADAKK